MRIPSVLAALRLALHFAASSWRGHRPITTGERLDAIAGLELPLAEPVAIHWNAWQVPFVEAQTDRDLAVGLGVVHGHLRLFQIDMMRRIAKGTLSELFGSLALDIDRSLRIVGFRAPVDAIERSLPDATRAWLGGFVDGIHAMVAQAGAQALWRRGDSIKVPLELAAVRKAFTYTTRLVPAHAAPSLAAE